MLLPNWILILLILVVSQEMDSYSLSNPVKLQQYLCPQLNNKEVHMFGIIIFVALLINTLGEMTGRNAKW